LPPSGLRVGRALDAEDRATDNAEVRSTPTPPSEWVEMKLRGLILDPQNEVPVLVLREEEGSVHLPIWIGVFEASAIALALDGAPPRRPMTHDLLRGTLEALKGRLLRIEIHSLVEGTYLARLRIETAAGEIEVDARPSDAIALALRCGSPIWTARQVLEDALSAEKASRGRDEERLKEWLANARPEDLGKYSM
jgi:uncharacterized protein